MADYFFYGTLRYLPLLQLVLGRGSDGLVSQPASLADYAVVQRGDEPFPHLVAAQGQHAEGVFVTDVTRAEAERLRFYESGFDFHNRRVEIELDTGAHAQAQVFFPDRVEAPGGTPWSLSDWISTWSDVSVIAAREAMVWFGRKTGPEIEAAFPGIRRRASAYVAAQQRPADPERPLPSDVIVKSHSHPYTNFFSMQEVDMQVRQYDGEMSPVMNRGALLVGEAAVVLPYDPVRDCVMLVEQFRAPLFIAGDRSPWIWEPIAGLLEPGEDATTAARREALEEAGLTLGHMASAGEMYSSTGSSTEYLYLFVGFADLSGDVVGVGGTDEGEDIKSRVISYDTLMQGIDGGAYKDMPLVTMALWLARHRDRLRALP